MDDRGLFAKLGAQMPFALYVDNMNLMVFFRATGATFSPAETVISSVHEATHAIQDWFNVVSFHKYTETDAYIAERVAAAVVPGGTASGSSAPVIAALDAAAKLATSGNAPSPGPGTDYADWHTAYLNVVPLIERALGAKQANLPADMLERQGQDEEVIFRKLLATLKKP
jgi:hypothetical protein